MILVALIKAFQNHILIGFAIIRASGEEWQRCDHRGLPAHEQFALVVKRLCSGPVRGKLGFLYHSEIRVTEESKSYFRVSYAYLWQGGPHVSHSPARKATQTSTPTHMCVWNRAFSSRPSPSFCHTSAYGIRHLARLRPPCQRATHLFAVPRGASLHMFTTRSRPSVLAHTQWSSLRGAQDAAPVCSQIIEKSSSQHTSVLAAPCARARSDTRRHCSRGGGIQPTRVDT